LDLEPFILRFQVKLELEFSLFPLRLTIFSLQMSMVLVIGRSQVAFQTLAIISVKTLLSAPTTKANGRPIKLPTSPKMAP
jgi:hypothetical protein